MKNPPDPLFILIFAPVPILAYGSGLYFLYQYNDVLILMFSIILGTLPISVMLYRQLISRPREIEVDEKVVLRYRFKTVCCDIESLEYLEISGKPDRITRKWSAGTVKFFQDKNGIPLTYEISKALDDAYYAKTGRVPPLPPWRSTGGHVGK